MFKVFFVLKQVVIRLKECQVDVVIRKNDMNLVLCSKCKVVNGFANINTNSQFYLHPDDPTLHMQAILFLGNNKKLGGEVFLTVNQWEPNVLHNSISQMINSPDKQARLTFSFYYFKDESITDPRPLFLSNDRHHEIYESIKKRSFVLNNEKSELEQELANWSGKNQKLEGDKKLLMQGRANLEELHHSNISQFQAYIKDNNEQASASKELIQKLLYLMKNKGVKMHQSSE